MLKVTNLRKEFDTVVAVDGVSLEVQRGEVFGLLGPNGAGKTTTIRTILNIIKPDRGSIEFDAKPFSAETWNVIGYLPEERGLYRKSKVISTILYFAALKGVKPQDAKPKALRWLDRFSLVDRANDKVEELSKGNQQKVQLISSLLHDPSLLILDEPFAGLDPVNQVILKDILMELRHQNIAIIFSTHQMEQVEKMCDNICLINKGKPVLNGSLRSIKQQYGKNSIYLEFDGDASFLKKMPGIRRANIYQNYAEVELEDPSKSSALLRYFDGKLSLRKFELVEPSLNSIFIDVVGPPPEAKPEPAKPAVQKSGKLPVDPRLKRQLFSLALVTVIAIVIIISNLLKGSSDWGVPAVLLGAAGITAFNLYRMKKKIEAEQKSSSHEVEP